MYVINNNIVIVWSIQDVIDCAKEREINLTEHQAKSVLVAIADDEDSSRGVNWDVINEKIDEILVNNNYSKEDVENAEDSAEYLLSEILGDYVITSGGIGRPSKALSDTLDSIEKVINREY